MPVGELIKQGKETEAIMATRKFGFKYKYFGEFSRPRGPKNIYWIAMHNWGPRRPGQSPTVRLPVLAGLESLTSNFLATRVPALQHHPKLAIMKFPVCPHSGRVQEHGHLDEEKYGQG